MAKDHDVTRLLQAWGDGDGDALRTLIPLVMEDLRRMARYLFQSESNIHTLQPTALISELYLRLHNTRETDWTCRRDFFYFAAELMRHILVDSARTRETLKRGKDFDFVPLDMAHELAVEPVVDLVALDMALEDLRRIDERQFRVVELRFFGGLSVQETADVLGIGPATVKRDWKTAKYWLHRRLNEDK